ncbi:MAG: hypothetical protein KIT73_13915 [Burkholderiales bacterium]|nr:hypothetical protein [Burkholderiales bacterium]
MAYIRVYGFLMHCEQRESGPGRLKQLSKRTHFEFRHLGSAEALFPKSCFCEICIGVGLDRYHIRNSETFETIVPQSITDQGKQEERRSDGKNVASDTELLVSATDPDELPGFTSGANLGGATTLHISGYWHNRLITIWMGRCALQKRPIRVEAGAY